MTRQSLILACTLAFATFAGCTASPDQYPSLDIRPAERVTGEFEPVSPTPVVEPAPSSSADLTQRLAQLRSDAAQAHDAFMAAQPQATLLAEAAAGSETGSNAWADAQVALADLESARSQAAIALGDLDTLYLEATLESADREQIESTRTEVIALLKTEDQLLAKLRGKVR